ncbi:MAG: malectin [Verrucomicrobiae bacterium]|nr:malectin [Verrucomicrobiae bacterium]
MATAPVAAKALSAPIRINAGTSAAVKDSTGIEWLGDMGFSGGDVIERPDQQIANTRQPEIYRSEHYSMEAFSQKLPNGKYQVKLHFCETYDGITDAGQRVFTFELGGKTFKDFDVWAKAGGFARAYVETVPVEITNGQLDIKFTAQTENPEINAIEIIPVQ